MTRKGEIDVRYDIPFNKPFLTGRELDYIQQSVDAGHISGDGAFTRKCESLLEEILGARRVLLTTSCTDALELTALLLRLGPEDEVVVPSFTFVSTANAYALRGATPVFADVRPDTLNIDESRIERLLTPRTRAIVVVHYAGVGCEMDEILRVASARGIPVVEDNAHGLFGTYKGRPLGSLGALATQSFHETKNVSCGEGGALVVNDDSYAERSEILREKGTNRKQFYRGQVDKYTWVDLGSSFLPSDILAAFLFAQLSERDAIQARRRRIYETYERELSGWASRYGVVLPAVPPHCEQPYHMFHMVLPDGASRDALIAHLRERSILAVFHYQPLHLSEMGVRFGGRTGDCPVTESICGRLARLPFYGSMTEAEQQRVVAAVTSFSP
ncbi:MAG: dTDP-4-amino-4,6-dideoxygalactose transaminase [Thermoanaerobaculia bacterium]